MAPLFFRFVDFVFLLISLMGFSASGPNRVLPKDPPSRVVPMRTTKPRPAHCQADAGALLVPFQCQFLKFLMVILQ